MSKGYGQQGCDVCGGTGMFMHSEKMLNDPDRYSFSNTSLLCATHYGMIKANPKLRVRRERPEGQRFIIVDGDD